MDNEQMKQFVERFLDAWNSQDVETVAHAYTDDVVFCDPNTRGEIRGGENLRRYLRKLLAAWDMKWVLREGYPFQTENGGAFLWRAEIKKRDSGNAVELLGMDLIMIRDGKVSRNEVYFDRTALSGVKG